MAEERLSFTTRICRPAADVFAWHERRGALARLIPPWTKVQILEQEGGIRDGGTVRILQRVGPITRQWNVEHRGYAAGREFRDVQVSGPFAAWEHRHRVEPDGVSACWLHDELSYRLPGGRWGERLLRDIVRSEIIRAFQWRQTATRADLELTARYGGVRKLRILVAGASGLVGRSLVPFLQTQGHDVVCLVRRAARTPEEISWDPSTGHLSAHALEGADAVIHLGGENVAGGRWTQRRKEQIRSSRIESTRTLVNALRTTRVRPAVFLCASAVGIYGDRGDELVSEDTPAGDGFLAAVCREWEAEALAVEALGVRPVLLRFGIVLSPAGGALAKMLPAFRTGTGATLGSGRQWMSWISIDDAMAAIYHAVLDRRCVQAINVVAPSAVMNDEFTRTLGAVLSRPTWLRAPAFALKAIFGEMAEETLLISARANPDRLRTAEFEFRHRDLEAALRHVLGCAKKEVLD